MQHPNHDQSPLAARGKNLCFPLMRNGILAGPGHAFSISAHAGAGDRVVRLKPSGRVGWSINPAG